LRSHDGGVTHLKRLAGHDLGLRHGGLDFEPDTGPDNAVQLLPLVDHEGIR